MQREPVTLAYVNAILEFEIFKTIVKESFRNVKISDLWRHTNHANLTG